MKNKTKIALVVDDSPLIVTKITELLKEIEDIVTIKSCGTYKEAIILLHNVKPSIVLLDINLPDKNGIALLKYIKDSIPEIIVVMVTNQSDDFYRHLCFQLGASDFIDKSADFEKLSALIASLC